MNKCLERRKPLECSSNEDQGSEAQVAALSHPVYIGVISLIPFRVKPPPKAQSISRLAQRPTGIGSIEMKQNRLTDLGLRLGDVNEY
jgi:hypothetical protein